MQGFMNYSDRFNGVMMDIPPGGVSCWFKQDEIHQATHVDFGPEFLPWHRQLTNHFEEFLHQINPQFSLHCWGFTPFKKAAEDVVSVSLAACGRGETV